MMKIFVNVLAGSTISAAIYIQIFYRDEAFQGGELLWQLIIAAFLCSLCKVIPEPKKELSKWRLLLHILLLYIYEITVMLSCAFFFKWIDEDHISSVILFIALVTIVFFLIAAGLYYAGLRETKGLNEKLKRYQNKNEE